MENAPKRILPVRERSGVYFLAPATGLTILITGNYHHENVLESFRWPAWRLSSSIAMAEVSDAEFEALRDDMSAMSKRLEELAAENAELKDVSRGHGRGRRGSSGDGCRRREAIVDGSHQRRWRLPLSLREHR